MWIDAHCRACRLLERFSNAPSFEGLRHKMLDPVAVGLALALTLLGCLAIWSGRRRRAATTAAFLAILNTRRPERIGGQLWYSADGRIYRVTKLDRKSGPVLRYVDDKDARLTVDSYRTHAEGRVALR